MKIKILYILTLSIFFSLAFTPVESLAKNSTPLIDPNFRATKPVEEHFCMGEKAMQAKDWEKALRQFKIVALNFPCTSYASDAIYFSGVSYFHLGYYEQANKQFSCYLKQDSIPRYFEEVFCYKFAIAEKFRRGSGKHLFGFEHLPQWFPATEEAIELYDEIATTLPNDELAPKSIYAKGLLLREMKDYKGSIEAIQTLIRRYPKEALSAAGFLLIATDYYHLARCQPNNPDLLALALINIRRFGQDFPGDPRISQAMQIYSQMEEFYACGLFEMGEFYERTCNPKASIIYYTKTVNEFPDTKVASKARNRLNCLEPYLFNALN